MVSYSLQRDNNRDKYNGSKLQYTGDCGLVYLRSEKLIKNGTVEIEYYPSKYVMNNGGSFSWVHTNDKKSETLILADESYKERFGLNNKYVLTIYMFSGSMNGKYSVYCGQRLLYTNEILLKLPEQPSVPVLVGLRSIENCTDCIVGEDNEMFKLECEIHGGSRPLTVTMTIGNDSYKPQEWNSTTYMVFFTVRNHHHMKIVICSVMNDALSSPLNVTAKMFVIINPDGRETSDYMSTTAYPGGIEKGDNMSAAANQDGIKTGDNMSTTGTTETGVGLGAVLGSVIGALAVGILIGVICTYFILTRKGILADSKPQQTVSRDIELTGPPTALDIYEQLQNRTDTEIRGTYDSLE
ncbi:uncharacterized protein LOC132734591, partial [Ruditapes philippinarum]|uniref:uncharacterized protein LOC132734591 n=1 Tax=Ruditapes philippinarum TaxID=129788 RepID=UPI00295B800E